jgi:hypothetical protein
MSRREKDVKKELEKAVSSSLSLTLPKSVTQLPTPNAKKSTSRSLLSEFSEQAVSSNSDVQPHYEDLLARAFNFDDSSDEEEQDVDQCDLDDVWEKFKVAVDARQMIESGSTESQIAFSFLSHFIGIQLLHGQEVNKIYYREKQKYLGLPAEQLPSNAQIRDWVKRSLEAALTSFLSSFQMNEADKLKIINFLLDRVNINQLFVAMSRVDINLQLKTIVLQEALAVAEKMKSNQDLNSSSSSQDDFNSKEELSPFDSFIFHIIQQEYNKDRGVKKSSHQIFLENYDELIKKYIISLDKKDKKRFIRDMVADNKLVLPQSSASSQAALLFYYLFVRELQKNIVLLRWLRPTLPENFSFQVQNAAAFFSNIRLSNRSITREARNIIDHEKGEQVVRSVNDWQQVMPSIFRTWSFQDSSTATDRQELQCKFNRVNYVTDVRSLGRDNSIERKVGYSELLARIAELGGDVIVAQNLRNYLNNIILLSRGNNGLKRAVRNEDKDFYADLTYLFLGLESTRNPAMFVLNQMLLDLIIFHKRTWQMVIDWMPMVPAGAVPASRQLNRKYDAYMPHHYEYPGDDLIQGGYTVSCLVKAEAKIVHVWLEERAKRPDLLVNPENKMEQIRGVIMEAVKGWYPGLIPVVNLIAPAVMPQPR